MKEYVPLLVFIPLVIAIGIVPLVISYLIAPRVYNKSKYSPYECGFPASGPTRMPFDIRYYLVALFFILFDIETAFFIPWAVSLRDLGWPCFFTGLAFLGILTLGFFYEWSLGALEWE